MKNGQAFKGTVEEKGCLATLRLVLGKTQKEMADMLNCSLFTVRAIEQGKLKLSERLAQRVSAESGVSVGWLLNGDPNVSPVSVTGIPFDLSFFENYRAPIVVIEHPFPECERTGRTLAKVCRRIMSILASAEQQGTKDLFNYKAAAALDKLEKQFGGIASLAPKPVSAGKQPLPSWKKDLHDAAEEFSRLLSNPKQGQATGRKKSSRAKAKNQKSHAKIQHEIMSKDIRIVNASVNKANNFQE